MPQSLTHDFLFAVQAPPSVMGTALISADRADHVVTHGEAVTVTASVVGAVEAWVNLPTGRLDLAPTGGTFSFVPHVSGPFPLFAKDAAGGVVVKPMSVIVKVARPALDPLAPPTLVTAQNGPLDDPTTWGGRLPTFDETVEVKHGCTYSGRQFWCGRLINTGAVVVRGGVLHTTDYDDRGVGALSLIGEGYDKSLVMLHNRPRHANDTADFWRCVKVLGSLTVLGKPVRPFARLAAPAMAGHTSLSLAAPADGWGVGNKVLLTDTRQLNAATTPGTPNYIHHEEIVVVRGKSADGLTVYLLDPVKYDHLYYDHPDAGKRVWPVAACLIRNAGFLTSDPTDVPTRAHVWVEGKARLEMRRWLVHGTGRTGLAPYGTTNKADRNPLRLYNLGTGGAPAFGPYTFVVEDGVTLDPPPIVPMGQSAVRWGLALDGSHYGLIKGNVSFNWAGASFACMAGTETANVLEGNLASCLSHLTLGENGRNSPDLAFSGTGLWFKGPNNIVRDNVAHGVRKGYVVYSGGMPQTVKLPAYPGADPALPGQSVTVTARAMGLRLFERNEVASAMNGLELWYVGSLGWLPAPGWQPSEVKDFVAWHVYDKTFYNYMTSGLTFTNVRMLAHMALARQWKGANIGMFFSDYVSHEFKVQGGEIRGYGTGVLVNPTGGSQTFEGVTLSNYHDFNIGVLWTTGHQATELTGRAVRVENCTRQDPAWPSRNDLPPQGHVVLDAHTKGGTDRVNLIAPNTVDLANHLGAGNNYRLYWNNQGADVPFQQTVLLSNGQVRVLACPVEGLTNEQSLAAHGVCWGAALMPSGAAAVPSVAGGKGA